MINIQFTATTSKGDTVDVIIQHETVKDVIDAYNSVIDGLTRKQGGNVEYLKAVDTPKVDTPKHGPASPQAPPKRRNTKELRDLSYQIMTQANLFRMIFPDFKNMTPDEVMVFLGFRDLKDAEIKKIRAAHETITAAINAYTSNNPDAAEFVKAFNAFDDAENLEALDIAKNETRWSLLKSNNCFIEGLKTLYESKKNLFEIAALCK